MPNSYRIVTRIQDQDDFAGSLTNDYYLKYSSGTGKFSLQPLSASPGGSSGQVQYNNAGSFGGAALVTYATSGTILTAAAGATTDVPFAVNGAASHTGDLAQFKVNGTTKFKVTAAGGIVVASNNSTTTSDISFDVATNTGLNYGAGGALRCVCAGTYSLEMGLDYTNLRSTGAYKWSANANVYEASDTGIKRSSAGVVTITDGSTGSGSLLLNAASSSTVPMTVKGAASQTAAILQLQNSSGSAYCSLYTVPSGAGTAILLQEPGRTDRNLDIKRDSSGNWVVESTTVGLTISAGYGPVLAETGGNVDSGFQFNPKSSGTTTITVGRNCTDWNFSHGTKVTDVACRKLIINGDTPYSSAVTNVNAGGIYLLGGAKVGSGVDGNIYLGYNGTTARGNLSLFGAGSFGSGVNVVFIANATTIPSTDPTGGGILYCEGGALKFRGSSGTVTTVAPA